jgi:hypothetical protein
LADAGLIDFNPTTIIGQVRSALRQVRSGYKIRHETLSAPDRVTLISDEGLAGIDPARWNIHRDLVLDLFGKEATIWITLRDPDSWLRSVYQQAVHEGYVIEPEDFFLSASEYDIVNPHYVDSRYRFALDQYDLGQLVAIYRRTFRRVLISPLEHLMHLDVPHVLFPDASTIINDIGVRAAQKQHLKISYSSRAMRLTLRREHLLSGLYLRSGKKRGSLCEDAEGWASYRLGALRGMNLQQPSRKARSYNIGHRLQARIRKELLLPFGWRDLMHRLDRWFPTSGYELPPTMSFGKHAISNRKIYETLLQESETDHALRGSG